MRTHSSDISDAGWKDQSSLSNIKCTLPRSTSFIIRGEDLNKKIELIRSLFGDISIIHTVNFKASAYPSSFKKMLVFLRELVRNPLADMRELAEASYIYEKTAANYFSQLAEARAFIFEPVLDFRRSDVTTFHLGIFTETEKRTYLVKRLKEKLHRNWLGTNQTIDFIGIVCMADSFGRCK
jgi:hypothetical protein